MKRKNRGINEIKIRLLPEKSKRDFMLRVVSYIIVLIFLIGNIVFVYIPYHNLNNELHNLRNNNSLQDLEYGFLVDKYEHFYHDIYNKNEDLIETIKNNNPDYAKIIKLFQNSDDEVTFVDIHDNLSMAELLKPENNVNLKPKDSVVTSVNYKQSEFNVTIQFGSFYDAIQYEKMLKSIKYALSVSGSVIRPNVDNTVYTQMFTVIIDPNHETCPKVVAYK